MRRAVLPIAAAAALLLLAGCGSRGSAVRTITPGTSIPAGEKAEFVAIGRDNGGCMMYRMRQGRRELNAIFYATADLDFTTDRREVCRS